MNIEKLTIKQLINRLTPGQLTRLGSTVVAVIIGAYFLGNYLAGIKYESQISEKEKLLQNYRSQWASIEPRLQMDKSFDIEKHVISVDSREIPPGSVLINKEFLSSKTIPGLTYTQLTIPDYRSLVRRSPQGCDRVMDDLAPVHLWKGTPVYTFENHVVNRLFPHIVVQKFSRIRLQNKLVELFNCWHTNEQSGFRIGKEVGKDLLETARNIDRVDIVGLYYALLQFESLVVTIFNSNIELTSNQVQKNRQTLIGSNFYTLKNVRLTAENSKQVNMSEFYIRDQIIMVEVPRHIYYIHTVSPSSQITRDVTFDKVTNQWLASLRLFYD